MSPTSRQATANTAPPFKVHRGSGHLIHKQPPAASSSSSSSSSNSSVTSGLPTTTNNAAAHRPPPRQQQQQQPPVIIYTHSPKIIRTNPRDFMSIVQKLTGLESSVVARAGSPSPPTTSQHDESSSSTDSCTNTAVPPPYVDHMPSLGTHRHFMPPEIPPFAPAASELPLRASRGLYGGPFAPVMSSANMNSAAGGTVFSPHVAFPDH
ncbi:hypothetical protein E2562_034185 [Oryza meyeriana var. granulata]|uniref:VQ domain-containing protein n=1 Tax=Oryza meyeriana var. granulata TaxID=110450 RepID=A0A6G1F1A1_9ORYZ|nr:hypothetical protein E2562_034185 [Oryza meyeriana var. granulata]